MTRVTKVALTGKERSARKMLASIVKFLQVGDIESSDLWAILTALRGPDSGNDELKRATTSRLRHAIGLREYESGPFWGHFHTSQDPLTRTIYAYDKSVHFVTHFNSAVDTLDKFNRQEQKEINAKLDALTSVFDRDAFRKANTK